MLRHRVQGWHPHGKAGIAKWIKKGILYEVQLTLRAAKTARRDVRRGAKPAPRGEVFCRQPTGTQILFGISAVSTFLYILWALELGFAYKIDL